MKSKNECPRQVWTSIHQKQSLVLDYYLDAADGDIPPLMLHNGFSRMQLTLIDKKDAEKKALNANIRAHEIPYILDQYQLILSEKFNFCPDDIQLAFRSTLLGGKLKGKTPGDVLLSGEATVADITAQINFLQKGVDRFPRNAEIIESCTDAINRYQSGTLTRSSHRSGRTLFREDMKTSAAVKNGMKKYSKIAIGCDYTMNSPWFFRIENGLYPFVNGTVDRKQPINTEVATMMIGDMEMSGFINALRVCKNNMEMLNFRKALTWVEENSWKPQN